MDGFKNTTKMKYMCGGPVRKAMGGAIKSVAPKSVSKSAASAKQLPTPEIAPKRPIVKTPPKNIELPRPEMAQKRLVMRAPPKDVRTIGGEPRRSDEGISAKQRLAGTAGDYAAPPEDVRTIGGAPKAPKGGMTMGKSPTDGLTKSPMDRAAPTGPLGSVAKNPTKGGALLSKMARSVAGKIQKESPMSGAPKFAKTMSGAPKFAKTMGSLGLAAKTMGGAPKLAKAMGGAIKGAKTMGSVSPAAKTMGSVSPGAKTMGSVSPGAKTMGSVSPAAKRGVPVASNKPMIGQYKTGGYVSKSSFKW